VPYGTEVQIDPGAQVRTLREVGEADTAVAIGTGQVPVLATSRLFAWCEEASFSALETLLPDGSTSVAMRVQLDHVRAAAVGCRVTAIATLERVEGRRYVFVVSALDDRGDELATGRISRVVVETEQFISRACGSPHS
jgi:fluoroacetyl-CoA thioesterase